MSIHRAIALFPREELAARDADPTDEAVTIDLGLLGPVLDEIDDCRAAALTFDG